MAKNEKGGCVRFFINIKNSLESFFDCANDKGAIEEESDYKNVKPFEALYTSSPPGAYNQCDEKYRFNRGQHATFGMGMKFWFSEPLFGVVPGVIRTCVGFSGGKKSGPANAESFDHTQCVDVEYDPQVVSYRTLVQYFFANHDSNRHSVLVEFASVILYHNPYQKQVAIEEFKAYKKSIKYHCYTRISPAKYFYLADDEHQKYILLNYPALMESLHLVVGKEMIYSHRAAVLNGFIAGCAPLQDFENIKADLMLPPHVVIFMRKVIEANQPKVLAFPEYKVKFRI